MNIYEIEIDDLINRKIFMESHSCSLLPWKLDLEVRYKYLGIKESSEYTEKYATFYMIIMDNDDEDNDLKDIAIYDDAYMNGMPNVCGCGGYGFGVFTIAVDKTNGVTYSKVNISNPNNETGWNKYEELYHDKIGDIIKLLQDKIPSCEQSVQNHTFEQVQEAIDAEQQRKKPKSRRGRIKLNLKR